MPLFVERMATRAVSSPWLRTKWAPAGPCGKQTMSPASSTCSPSGVRLGMTAAQVERAWGTVHGVCRGCARTTWYFTYKRFDPRGAGVELVHGRVVAIFTLWSPSGWQTADRRLAIGDETGRITLVE